MVDLQLIEVERERRNLRSLFLGSLIKSTHVEHNTIGIVLDVYTMESMSIYDGITKENQFRVLSDDGIRLLDWRICDEISVGRCVKCIDLMREKFKT